MPKDNAQVTSTSNNINSLKVVPETNSNVTLSLVCFDGHIENLVMNQKELRGFVSKLTDLMK